MSVFGNFGLKLMRCCILYVSVSMEKLEVYVGELGCINKCFLVVDVEFDVEI